MQVEDLSLNLEQKVISRTEELNNEKAIAESERKKSDKLLLNILPESIAEELKTKGKVNSLFYESATVLFTDFVGFTKVTENLQPDQIVDELDNCFSYFDSVSRNYNLEKIKTIGDSYMTCAGIPIINYTHAIDTVLAAIEIQTFMNQMKQIKESKALPYWELRLGINTGPLVAGVIGDMKFQYDVFGDTVNTASRMESSGVSGKINISGSTYFMIKDYFECEYRGKVEAKNLGMTDMYFVKGVKSHLSMNKEGKVPNDTFREKYETLKTSRPH